MPIEFRCSGCGRLLRTADDTAGKQAKCPQCGEILTIPNSTTAHAGQPTDDGLNEAKGSELSSDPFATSETSTTNPYQTPTTSQAVESQGYYIAAAGAKLTPTTIGFSDVFTRTWEVFRNQLGTAVLFALCVFGVQIASNIVMMPIGMAANLAGNDTLVFALVQVLQQFWGLIVGAFVTCISVRFALDLMRGHPSPLSAMWNVGPFFLRILALNLLILLVVIVVGAVCAIPVGIAWLTQDDTMMTTGVIITAALAVPAVIAMFFMGLMIILSSYFIIDRGEGVIEGINSSMLFMKGNKLMVFLVLIVAGIVGLIFGCGTLCIGFLFVTPFTYLLMATIYCSATGQWISGDVNAFTDRSQFE